MLFHAPHSSGYIHLALDKMVELCSYFILNRRIHNQDIIMELPTSIVQDNLKSLIFWVLWSTHHTVVQVMVSQNKCTHMEQQKCKKQPVNGVNKVTKYIHINFILIGVRRKKKHWSLLDVFFCDPMLTSLLLTEVSLVSCR